MPHIHDKIDFTVEVFVVNKGRVLLRKHDKYKIWLSVGGHIELDEDPNQAAVREVKEEVGLDVRLFPNGEMKGIRDDKYKELISPRFLNIHDINDNHKHITLVYFATCDSDSLAMSEDERSDGCRWFTREELGEPIYGLKDNVRMHAEKALIEVGSHQSGEVDRRGKR